MSNINLKHFVDINIESHVGTSIDSTRDTVVLFTKDGENGTTNLITSMPEAASHYSNFPDTLAYLSVYFNNGGVKVLVIEGIDYSQITLEMIEDLDDKYIMIACVSTSSTTELAYAALKSIASRRGSDSSIYGINEKLILARTLVKTDSDVVKNLVVKYSSVPGAEMTIAAYLSKINVYGINTVYDYAFTTEAIGKENVNDADFVEIMNNHMNIDIMLANEIRNCGGDCKDGSDIVNTFVKIILHQTLTDSLINLLSQKLKNSAGISKIYTTISQELENYLNCGYLTTDKIWSDEDLTVTRNGVTYTIIEKGTPLINGYLITVLPMAALNEQEKTIHSAPPIYVIIADQYSIRKITITGEVI